MIENNSNNTTQKIASMQLSINSSNNNNNNRTLIEEDDIEDSNGWDQEESDPFDFNQPVDNDEEDNKEDNAWDSFDQPASVAFSPPPLHKSAASPVSSFGSYPSSFGAGGNGQNPKAQGSMKLGHKTKTFGKSIFG